MPLQLLRLGLLTTLLMSASTASAQDSLDSLITRTMAAANIPGLAAAIVQDGKIAWVGTYGFANIEAKRPVTRRTLFHIASTSKPVTATILMQLHSAGKFSLDDDINRYLPFEVRNPNYPNHPITFEMLLQHRSGIRDNPVFYRPLWAGGKGDSPVALGDYLRAYLSRNGKDYGGDNFFKRRPGAQYTYCNTCFALLGYLAERISGKPYATLSEESLFRPLGMTNTHWFLAQTDTTAVAMPYRYDSIKGNVPLWHGGYPDWPAGQLRTTIDDFARFLAAYSANGRWEGKPVIDSASIGLLSPRAPPGVGALTWQVIAAPGKDPLRPHLMYWHGGGDAGVTTLLGFSARTRDGIIILINGQPPGQHVTAIRNAILLRALR